MLIKTLLNKSFPIKKFVHGKFYINGATIYVEIASVKVHKVYVIYFISLVPRMIIYMSDIIGFPHYGDIPSNLFVRRNELIVQSMDCS